MLVKRIFLIIALFLLWGCSRSEIQGIVKDVFGKVLSDVQVSIDNTNIKATTKKDGSYTIPYILGTFKVTYAKSGYTTHKLDLTIQEKSLYPAQPIVLYPIPNEAGIYYLDKNTLVKLSPVKTIVQDRQKGGLGLNHDISLSPAKLFEQIVVQSGKAQFIDMHPEKLILMQLSNGVFLNVTQQTAFGLPGPAKINYDGSIQDEQKEFGEEKLVVRSLNLDPGAYAWVEFSEEVALKPLSQFAGVSFPFTVGSKDQSQSIVPKNLWTKALDATELASINKGLIDAGHGNLIAQSGTFSAELSDKSSPSYNDLICIDSKTNGMVRVRITRERATYRMTEVKILK